VPYNLLDIPSQHDVDYAIENKILINMIRTWKPGSLKKLQCRTTIQLLKYYIDAKQIKTYSNKVTGQALNGFKIASHECKTKPPKATTSFKATRSCTQRIAESWPAQYSSCKSAQIT